MSHLINNYIHLRGVRTIFVGLAVTLLAPLPLVAYVCMYGNQGNPLGFGLLCFFGVVLGFLISAAGCIVFTIAIARRNGCASSMQTLRYVALGFGLIVGLYIIERVILMGYTAFAHR